MNIVQSRGCPLDLGSEYDSPGPDEIFEKIETKILATLVCKYFS
jgi:hypothetical protein